MKVSLVRIPPRFLRESTEPPGMVTVARVDRRTKNITRRLNPGEIAIINHADLDRVSAEELIRRKVAAVVNASASITGRYPNLGPQLLLEAGIPVINAAGPDVMVTVADGAVVRLDHETLYLGDGVVAKGTPLTAESVLAALAEARAMIGLQIESFAANALEFSTVDDADLAARQSAIILAIASQLTSGRPGSYGIAANGAIAVAPSLAPTP